MTDMQLLRERAAMLIYAELSGDEWNQMTPEDGEAMLQSKMEYLSKLADSSKDGQ